MTLKRAIHILLSLSIGLQCLAPSLGEARGFNRPPLRKESQLSSEDLLNRVNTSYGRRFRFKNFANRALNKENLAKGVEKMAKGLGPKSAEFAGHQFQTILIITMLNVVAIAREHLKLAGIEKRGIDPKAVSRDIGQSVAMLIDSPDYWSSVIGGMGAGVPAVLLQVTLEKILSDLVLKQAFKMLITNGATTLVTFVGWEFGAELTSMARMSIDNEADFKRSERLGMGTMLTAVFANGANKQRLDFEQRENLRVFLLLLDNMKNILFEDADLRGLLIANTWKHHVATGPFLTMVTFMTAGSVGAGMVGSVLAPGPGTVAGIGFGMVGGFIGGLAAMFVPKKDQDNITAGIRNTRKFFWSVGKDHSQIGSGKAEATFKGLYECISKEQMCSAKLLEDANKYGQGSATNNWTSVKFEEFFDFEKDLADSEKYFILSQVYKNTGKMKEYAFQMLQTTAAYKKKLAELDRAGYILEHKQMTELFKRYPLKREWVTRYPQLKVIFYYYADLDVTVKYLKAYTDATNKSLDTTMGYAYGILTVKNPYVMQIKMPEDNKPYMDSLYQIYFYGFTKQGLLDSVTQPATQGAS